MPRMFDPDGRLALAESGHTEPVRLSAWAVGGDPSPASYGIGSPAAETYAYRGYRFTITRDRIGWWCHEGAGKPGELIGLRHEAGWFTYRRKRIVRKIARAIDRRERDVGRQEMAYRCPTS